MSSCIWYRLGDKYMKRMKKIDIIASAEQLEDLKEALNRIGVQGMTV